MIPTGGAIDFFDPALVRVSGADRSRYLNGQISNDLTLCTPETSIEACVTDHRGKLQFPVFVHCLDDAYLVEGPPGESPNLLARLERYAIADDVVFEDRSGSLRIVHLWGDPPPDVSEIGLRALRNTRRLRDPGLDCFYEGEFVPDIEPLPEVDLETLRVLFGIPAWLHELKPGILPPEARMETRAISYTKGCYIGQEVISRLKSVGGVRKILVQWSALDGPEGVGRPLEREELFSPADPARSIGRITTATAHPDLESPMGLAIVRREHSTPGTKLLVRGTGGAGGEAMIRINPFPGASSESE